MGIRTLAVALPLAAGLAGCGGGGGGTPSDSSKDVPAPSSPVVTPTPGTGATSFVPNYSAELEATRRWDKSVVTVGFTAPIGANGAPRDVGPLVQQAIDLWNSKVSQGIRFELTDSPEADVKVSWVATGTLPSDSIGRTQVRFRNVDQVLISAAVSIEQSLPDSFQVQVIAHELGHSLGIEGHSTLQSDLMYANAHLPVEITTRDRNTILKAYSVEAGRSVQPVTSDGDVSTVTSAAQYICRSDEFTPHH